MGQLLEYQTFMSIKEIDGEAPPGYKKIRCHIRFMMSNMTVATRHALLLVDILRIPTLKVFTPALYHCVVYGLIVFLAELNGLELWGADVGNAYLEAKTKEKVYIVAGPEFGPLGRTYIAH